MRNDSTPAAGCTCSIARRRCRVCTAWTAVADVLADAGTGFDLGRYRHARRVLYPRRPGAPLRALARRVAELEHELGLA